MEQASNVACGASEYVAEAINLALSDKLEIMPARVLLEIQRLALSNIDDIMEIVDNSLVIKQGTDLDRDTLSTIASIEENINERGYKTIKVKQHDKLRALELLTKVMAMQINRTELSGPQGGPVEVEHTDYRERITRRLDEMAKRVVAPTEQPIIDVTPAQQALPAVLLAARIHAGRREE